MSEWREGQRVRVVIEGDVGLLRNGFIYLRYVQTGDRVGVVVIDPEAGTVKVEAIGEDAS